MAAPVRRGASVASPNRIARLKRFDLSWQAALGKLDSNKLSPAGKADLATLKATIQTNLAASTPMPLPIASWCRSCPSRRRSSS